ncbi:ARID DNA-binding domain-containing protein [Tanacetum coccineum]
MGPNYVPGEKKDLYVKSVHKTVIWMGEKQEAVEDVPCGNTVALVGLDQFITKTATLTNEKESDAYPIRAMKFSVSPVIRVAVQCKDASDLPQLVEGLKLLSKSDPMVVCTMEESGEHIIAGCQHVVAFRETVLEKSSRTVMSKSPNKHNRLYMEAQPMEEGLVEAIDEGRIGPRDNPKIRGKILTEEFGWNKDLAKKICQGTENGVKPIHKRDQIGITRRYMQKETPQRRFPWNSRKKNLSPESKEMLLKKMKERPEIMDKEVLVLRKKERRARCYICKIRGHVFWKCPNKKKKAMIGKQKEIVKPTIKKVTEKIKYPEKVHVITDYMIEGTDDATWNEAWYVSSAYKNHMCPTRSLFKKLTYKFKMIEKEEIEKKFIFSYGVGDVIVEAREGNFVIPNVHYTPEVTLNVLSFDLLEEQRLDEIPPVVGVMEINLLSLHKMVDNLGGYMCVTLGDKWKTIASLQGLTEDDQKAIKRCYKRFIDMVQVYYETAKMSWYEKKPKEDVVESSSDNARVKDPQGKEKDDAGKEKALEEDMNMTTQFGVRLVGNIEKEAEKGSITDNNDFEVIV